MNRFVTLLGLWTLLWGCVGCENQDSASPRATRDGGAQDSLSGSSGAHDETSSADDPSRGNTPDSGAGSSVPTEDARVRNGRSDHGTDDDSTDGGTSAIGTMDGGHVDDGDGGSPDGGTNQTDGAVTTRTSCCRPHGTGGCADPDVEACVCAQDESCCTDRWDIACVGLVSDLECGSCKSDCCSASTEGGCTDPQVESCLCEAQPECCESAWDTICVYAADEYCNAQCS